MTEATTLAPHIVRSTGKRGGRPYIDGRGIAVDHVAYLHEELAVSAVEIAAEYELSLAEVHAALAYYFDHRPDIDRRRAEDSAYVEDMRRTHSSLVAERLRERGA